MGSKMNEYESMVVREIELADGRVLSQGHDGQSHRTITFAIGDVERTYRYPSSGQTNGCAMKNARAGLRRLIKTMIPQPETNDTQTEQQETNMNDLIIETRPTITTPKALRRAMAAYYLLPNMVVNDVAREFEVSYAEAIRSLKLAGGRAARKVKEEISVRVHVEKHIDALMDGKKAPESKKLRKVVEAIVVEDDEAEITPGELVEAVMNASEKKPKNWKGDIEGSFKSKLPGSVVQQADDLFQIDLACKGCGVVHPAVYNHYEAHAPYRVIQHLREQGWQIGQTDHYCPDHLQRNRAASDEPGTAITTGTTEVSAVGSAQVLPAVPSTPAALRAARRAVVAWLDESFDLQRHCYREGMNDEKIAAETGLSVTEVAAIREDLYGPLGPPEELLDLMLKVEVLDDKIKVLSDTFVQQRDALLQEAADLRNEFAAKIVELGYAEPVDVR